MKDLHVLWPPEMSQLRIDGETRIERRRGARKDQVLVDGIDAQSRVVNAGGELWNSVLNWGVVNGRLSGKDQDILRVASAIPVRIPTELQSKHLVALLQRLHGDGCSIGKDVP